MDDLSCFHIDICGLNRTSALPLSNDLAYYPIHGLGKCSTRFVDGNIKEANCIPWEYFSRSNDHEFFSLPSNTSYTQTENFILTQPTEQPDHHQRLNHLDRIKRAT